METVITSKGQLVIPKAIRDQEQITSGTRFSVSVETDHSIRLRKIDEAFLTSLMGTVEKGVLEQFVSEKEVEKSRDRF